MKGSVTLAKLLSQEGPCRPGSFSSIRPTAMLWGQRTCWHEAHSREDTEASGTMPRCCEDHHPHAPHSPYPGHGGAVGDVTAS